MPAKTETLDELVDAFAASPYGSMPDVEPSIAWLLLDARATYLGEEDPGVWPLGDIHELITQVVPRKFLDDGSLSASVPATLRALLTYLDGAGRLRSARPLWKLLDELDRATPQFRRAIADPNSAGLAKTLLSAMIADGVNPADEADCERWIDEFNARPCEERRALTDPALGFSADWGEPGPDWAGLEADEADEADDDETIELPPVRLPPTAELAASARENPTIRSLLALVEWVGPQRPVTDTGILRLADARAAIRALGLDADPWVAAAVRQLRSAWDVPELARLWVSALHCGLLVINGRRVMQGCTRPDGDEDVLACWSAVFAAWVGSLGTHTDPAADRVTNDLPGMLSALYAAREPIQVAELAEVCADAAAGRTVWPPDMMRRFVQSHLERIFTALEAFGALRSCDDPAEGHAVELTDLGSYAVREEFRRAGIAALAIGDLAELDATELLETIGTYPVDDANAECDAWIARRAPEQALHELAEAARHTDSPIVRTLAFAAFSRTADAAEPVVRGLLDMPLTRAHARSWLVYQGRATAPLSEADGHLLFLDTAASLIEMDQVDQLVSTHESTEMIADLWQADHPALLEVLDALGAAPDRRVAKAARKAAFKARSRLSH